MMVMENSKNQQEWYQIQEVELIYKSKVKASLRPVVTSAKQAYDVLWQTWDKNKVELQEQFKVLLINRGGKAVGIYELSTGGVAGTVADPRLIFMAALKANACSIILAHNHPSSNLKPSRADEELTRKIKEAGKFLEINVLDHIIVTEEGYYSFADEGVI
jgi:DNA repair protein RadC